ncbi:polysaccharide biosynthesis protein [bacterium]|nr:polysaccharide biosynthesis protein [candidate division CSSED10-310 bacterium]
MAASRKSKVYALSLGQGLTMVIGMASAMIMTRILSKSDLATYRQTMLAYEVVIPLLSLGIPSAMYYFLPTEKKRMRGVVVDALLFLMATGFLYSVFIALGGNHLLAKRFSNPAIIKTLVYLVPLPVVMLPASLLSSILVVRDQAGLLAKYNILKSMVLMSSIIIACLLWKTPSSMVAVNVIASLAVGLVAIFLIFRHLPHDDWHPRMRNMQTMVSFSIPLVLASALGTISLQLDKIIVSSLSSPEQFAVYSNGAFEIPFVGIITGSIMTIIQPELRKLIDASDSSGALMLFRTAALKSSAIILPAMIFLMVSAEPVILTLFSRKYTGSILPFQLYLLVLPMRIVYFGTFLIALGMSKTILYRSAVGLAANVVFSIILVKMYGYIGAIISTIICLYLVEGLWNFRAISLKLGCRWFDILPFGDMMRLLKISILAGIPVVFLGLILPPIPPVFDLAVKSTVYFIMIFIFARVFQVTVLQEEIAGVLKKVSAWRRV